jgi:ribosomal protein L37E
MAVVKASYTREPKGIKASLRYYTHRPTMAGIAGNREIFGKFGPLTKADVYSIIDRQRPGTYFYRLVLSPDPRQEDPHRSLGLERLTRQSLARFARLHRQDLSAFAAVCHTDHSDVRHVHVIACFARKLTKKDLFHLRSITTEQALSRKIRTPHWQATLPSTFLHQPESRRQESAVSLRPSVFVATAGIYPSVKPRQVCRQCGASLKLVWRYGKLRCSFCGFEARRRPDRLIGQEATQGFGLELTMRRQHRL